MKEYTAHDIAEYITESYLVMYQDGYYYVHYNPKTGFNYKGTQDPDNITVCVPCDYAEGLDRYEFDMKENESDPDFMAVCEKLADELNERLKA